MNVVRGDEPDEIVDFQLATDPYTNMLPGIANINAARTVGGGIAAGRRGRRLTLVVSLLLLLALIVVPVLLAVAQQLSSGS